ncbi:cellulase family glycosylhydrolase [Solwaraspora sp. WMMD406]|uniref:cellulase family glycosylhydrolase n=1 Tax=Solwaraspora sp. WMMD406 TaxID=3016095 RepID=UPI00241670E6|nr:cellulase family glycosylhydrolase [Solwaraspora sp. WMMD406]MDG4767181.1 cellulase family glycosylhydrolase [Solwaraspora sp. WMMD406]
MTRQTTTAGRRRWRAGLVAGGVTAALLGGSFAVAASAHAATGCRVIYSAPSQWPGGFTANVAVTNLGDPISGWQLSWTFPSGQQVTQAWNATITSSGGQVTATNVSYNANLGTNATVSFGFNGSWSGSNTAPTSFALNGVTCTGSVGPTTAPPTTAPPTTAPPTTAPPTTAPPTSTPRPPGNPQAIVDDMQPGWNLGNTLDATGDNLAGSGETSWGNPLVTQALIRNIKAQGFKSIRIPTTWTHHHGAAPTYTIDPTRLARVKQVVDWALAEDLYVMINLHHDSWQWIHQMPSNRTTVLARYSALWTQLAATFRDSSPKLHFESVNEPQFANSSGDAQNAQLLDELNRRFHQIVRGSGGNNATRLLILPTLHTSSDQARLDELASTFTALNDPNLIATVHYYGYWPFSVNVAGGYRFDATAQQDVIDSLNRVQNTFVSRGIPVVIGEYGLLGFDRHTGTIQQGEKLKFFEFFGYHTRTRKIATQLWDNGQHLGRTSFQWSDPELIAQIKSSWTTRSGTAASDMIFVPRTGGITAKTLALNLNGLTFQSLRQGNTELVRGTDYTISGNQLTLTASAVTRLVGNRAYGVNATLHAHFSAGVPWRINILSHDRPVLQNATGTTSAFSIPTAFNGDQLATMEARYADGSNAGPHNWTSYKEFDVTFAPNYSANTISLTSTFFAEVNDNAPVTLTFHFWSGATVTYTVRRSGSSVTGTAS